MRRKFRSKIAADHYASAFGYRAKAGTACKLKDGTKARWYTLTKTSRAKVKRRR